MTDHVLLNLFSCEMIKILPNIRDVVRGVFS